MKKILMLITLASLVLTGCAEYEDSYSPAAAPTTDLAVGFSTANAGNIETDQESLDIILKRNTTEGDLIVPIQILQNGGDVLKSVSEVAFADGSDKAVLTLNIDGAVNGGEYTFEAKIADSFNHNPYKMQGISPTLKTVVTTLVWDVYNGLFLAPWWLKTEDPQQVVVKHLQESDRWRLMQPFHEYYRGMGATDAQIAAQTCEYITFYIKQAETEDGVSYSASFDTFHYGWYDLSNKIMGFWPSDLADSQAPNNAHTKLLNANTLQMVPYAYVPGLGGWGLQAMLLQLTDGTFIEVPAEE